MPKKKYINLLPQEEFESSTVGRVLHWAMGSFRIIVIVTEMVVMAAFLSRFWLDAHNSTLSDNIKTATSQIQVQTEFEQKFRAIQAKLALFKEITSGVKNDGRIQLIAEKSPESITVSSIVLTETDAKIKGKTDAESNLAQFISNLKANETIKRVDLESLSSVEDDRSLITFDLKISY